MHPDPSERPGPSQPDPDSSELRGRLAAEIAGVGPAPAPQWLDAVRAVPRELFLGSAVYRPVGTAWSPVRREQVGEQEWLRMAHRDTTWVTQVDGLDAADADGPVTGSPTSSATLPSLVVRTAEVAELHEGGTVLEVGTGTGYSTAILCHRLGAENVVSVEYDPGLAALSAVRLTEAGYAPRLATGDGLQGCQEHAPYDAVIATCSVRSIPPPWFWQLKDGGSITTTVSGWMPSAGLIRLTLDEEGVAHGRFAPDTVTYMLARPHEPPPRSVFFRQEGERRAATVDPRLLERWEGRFVAQLAAPSAELVDSAHGIVLRDTATGSQAWCEPDGAGWAVHQHGPLRLWDRVEEALETWQSCGAPDMTGFGMTATPWEQTVWLGSPGGPSWHLPI
ncbi:ATP-grasp peptide maturase system methyltransferase [Streptomyces sp. XM4193]|uniref:ATP-grasp peptide maturase system methyltransferase n=1 Tax=Streptomyces sp. XM4193 TaxID=2929782 RepID=UPI001FFAD15C|nr:ATP-grasp peptide maturase system methyltransferase [Streptomyces sp. XM4193]MCK1796878.1 ATP-grasp peptide maturase system methyltransferase [Streptomyces sp. XM4193]